jgi:chloramphenicol 3-O-phosphotransferase
MTSGKPSPLSGHSIFITGVPSSGKSTLAREVESRATSFRLLSGDDAIREMHDDIRGSAHGLFLRLLDQVEDLTEKSNVIVDMSLPQSYVAEARDRFGSSSLFVGLRLPEVARRARDVERSDRPPVPWGPALTALRGPDNIYDLNLDTHQMSIAEAAEAVIVRAKEHWPDLTL